DLDGRVERRLLLPGLIRLAARSLGYGLGIGGDVAQIKLVAGAAVGNANYVAHRRLAQRSLGPLLGPTPRMKVAGGAVSPRAVQLPVAVVAGDATPLADRPVPRLGTQIVVTIVTIVTAVVFQWLAGDGLRTTHRHHRHHIVTNIVTAQTIAAVDAFAV